MSDQDPPASSGEADDFPTLHFSTGALPEAQRLAVWREHCGRTLLHVDIEPLSGEPVRAEATMRGLPGLRSLFFRGSAMRFARTQATLGADTDSIGFVINCDPKGHLSQRKRDVSLRAGDAALLLSDEPGTVLGRGHIGLLFPYAPLIERAANLPDFAAARIPANAEALRLLTAYLNALPDKFSASQPALRRAVVEHVYDLVTLAICPDRSINENSLSATAAARLELALGYIKTHFDSPGLTVAAVARDQNVSPRYLQRLIETTGITFSERVQELRLQRAYELLMSARRGERISDIALRAGFSDIAHFNRSFRRRFGDTPRNVRAAAFRLIAAAGRSD